jgi:hypothetical protein
MGCTLGSNTCVESNPSFPSCPGLPQKMCNTSGGSSQLCSEYCTAIQRCNQAGYPQYASDGECCALCAAIVGNPDDKSTLCCRADALNKVTVGKDACTKAGRYGTIDPVDGAVLDCGGQLQQVCGLLFHACSGAAIPLGCTVDTCQTAFGTPMMVNYKADDMSPDENKVMTLALEALVSSGSSLDSICDQAFQLACPG